MITNYVKDQFIKMDVNYIASICADAAIGARKQSRAYDRLIEIIRAVGPVSLFYKEYIERVQERLDTIIGHLPA